MDLRSKVMKCEGEDLIQSFTISFSLVLMILVIDDIRDLFRSMCPKRVHMNPLG